MNKRLQKTSFRLQTRIMCKARKHGFATEEVWGPTGHVCLAHPMTDEDIVKIPAHPKYPNWAYKRLSSKVSELESPYRGRKGRNP